MRFYSLLCIFVALMVTALPLSAAAALPFLSEENTSVSSPTVLANGENRYGSLYVSSVEYTMKNMDADIVVRYQIEP